VLHRIGLGPAGAIGVELSTPGRLGLGRWAEQLDAVAERGVTEHLAVDGRRIG
jgi:hypothetical protein